VFCLAVINSCVYFVRRGLHIKLVYLAVQSYCLCVIMIFSDLQVNTDQSHRISNVANWNPLICPNELEITETTSYALCRDINLNFNANSHLTIRLYDKRDDFKFSLYISVALIVIYQTTPLCEVNILDITSELAVCIQN